MCSYYTFLLNDLFFLHYPKGSAMLILMNFWANLRKNFTFHHHQKIAYNRLFALNFDNFEGFTFRCVVTTHFRQT